MEGRRESNTAFERRWDTDLRTASAIFPPAVESASPRDPGEMSERRCFRLSQKLRRSHARPVINTA